MDLAKSDEHLALAEQKLSEGDPMGAATQLRHAAFGDGLAHDDVRLVALIRTVAALAIQVDIPELAESATQAAGLVPQALFELGSHLGAVGLSEVGIPLLQHVDARVPQQEPVVLALVAAFEQTLRFAEARDVLVGNLDHLAGFWPRYLLCFNALSAGDVATATAHASLVVGQDDDEDAAAHRLQHMLLRSEAAKMHTPLDAGDLRGWHYVMNGAGLLHLSPYGHPEPMRGRYGFLQDTVAMIRRDLDRLVATLRALEALPARVLAMPDRSSAIVAGALGSLLSVPVLPFDEEDEAAVGLVVSYNVPEAWAPHPDRPLFARLARWAPTPAIVPDWVGLLQQHGQPPWHEDEGEGNGEDEAAAAVWIAQVEAAEPEAEPDFDAIEDVLALARLGGEPADRWSHGPVQSNRFL